MKKVEEIVTYKCDFCNNEINKPVKSYSVPMGYFMDTVYSINIHFSGDLPCIDNPDICKKCALTAARLLVDKMESEIKGEKV